MGRLESYYPSTRWESAWKSVLVGGSTGMFMEPVAPVVFTGLFWVATYPPGEEPDIWETSAIAFISMLLSVFWVVVRG